MKGLHRRAFVVHALTVCGASVLAPAVLVGRGGQQAAAEVSLARVATEYFGGRIDTARIVGEVYLRQLGVGAGQAAVLDATRATTSVIGRASTPQAVVDALVRAIQRDYREGRSVQIEGWVLAQTEVEVCALTLLPSAA